jgi:transposase InsO family protein
MRKDCNYWVQTCVACQRKARITYRDRTPIKYIERNSIPFSHFFMDALGPLCSGPPLAMNYCLILVDNHSRYPFAIPMRRVTARSVCDALIQAFSHTSLPVSISSDNASSFSSHLNKEFLKRFGISPLFISPLHSSGNGLAERMVGVLKSMINRVAAEHKQSWYKILPLLLWFIRETPNETTNVAPWTLVHGFIPKGLIEMVKQSWTGEQPRPVELNKSANDYLQELQRNLQLARDYASETASKMQARYVRYYNERSQDKSFQINDRVLILLPDSTNKAFAQWQGPGVIIENLDHTVTWLRLMETAENYTLTCYVHFTLELTRRRAPPILAVHYSMIISPLSSGNNVDANTSAKSRVDRYLSITF